MRLVLVSPILLGALAAASSARADCIGPYDCFCGRTSTSGPMLVAVVTGSQPSGDMLEIELEVESVHGSAAVGWAEGTRHTVQVWEPRSVGARVLVEPTDSGINEFNLVEERGDGSVACSGFSAKNLTLTDVIEARLADSCYEALQAQDPDFEVPECNDVIEGPFNCRAGPGPEAGVWAVLVGALWFARRRRAH